MKKIMIVDDEILVRVGIKSIVEWEKYGYQVVGEAADGKEALAMMEKSPPDIVLTDLVMSPMDGFELIEQCKTRFPRVRFVVLSSYNDMDNVKRAMKLGAMDYVFKLQVTAESLISLLDQVSGEMEKEQPAPQESGAVSRKNVPAVRQRLMQTIVEKSYLNQEDVFRELSQLQQNASLKKPFCLLLMSIDDFEIKEFSEVIQEAQLLKFSMANILEEVLGQGFVSDVYGAAGGDLIAVLQQDRSEEAMLGDAEKAFEQASEYIRRYLDISISGAVSGVCASIGQIPGETRSMRLCLQQRIYRGEACFFTACGGTGRTRTFKVSPEGLARDMDRAVSKKGDELIGYLDRFFKTAQMLESVQDNDVRESYFELYHALNHCASGYGIDVNQLTDEDGSRLHYVILKADTMTTIRTSFLAVAHRFLELLRSGKRPLVRRDILEAQKYIRNNLSEHLTVSGVAEMLNMNSSYFSHLFKKQAGKSFVDYVNEARIKKAKELFATTDYRIYEIATMVGIDSPNYFSALFKKITGKNPNDYRQR
ncbi:response regulator transcription factor [Caproiciproducens sp.]